MYRVIFTKHIYRHFLCIFEGFIGFKLYHITFLNLRVQNVSFLKYSFYLNRIFKYSKNHRLEKFELYFMS